MLISHRETVFPSGFRDNDGFFSKGKTEWWESGVRKVKNEASLRWHDNRFSFVKRKKGKNEIKVKCEVWNGLSLLLKIFLVRVFFFLFILFLCVHEQITTTWKDCAKIEGCLLLINFEESKNGEFYGWYAMIFKDLQEIFLTFLYLLIWRLFQTSMSFFKYSTYCKGRFESPKINFLITIMVRLSES